MLPGRARMFVLRPIAKDPIDLWFNGGLFQGHSLPRRRHHTRSKNRRLHSSSKARQLPLRRRDTPSLPPALHFEPAEASFLFRMDEMDCLHRETREGVRAADRAAQRPRVAGVHPFVTTPAHMN